MSDIDISIYPANSQKHVKYSSLFIDPKFRRKKKEVIHGTETPA